MIAASYMISFSLHLRQDGGEHNIINREGNPYP
jgi:hypothetical protein